jgi:hypothetical protein
MHHASGIGFWRFLYHLFRLPPDKEDGFSHSSVSLHFAHADYDSGWYA